MEAFEHVVKVYLETRHYIVTSGVKFPITKLIVKRSGRKERQTHGYEVDLVAARRDELILASVKSFFGSAGVHRQGFRGLADESKPTHFGRYTMFNERAIMRGMIRGASARFGYPPKRIRMCLFVGKFHRPDEVDIRKHLARLRTPAGTVEVIGLDEIVRQLLAATTSRTYINDPVLMTLKVLRAADLLKEAGSAVVTDGELDEVADAG